MSLKNCISCTLLVFYPLDSDIIGASMSVSSGLEQLFLMKPSVAYAGTLAPVRIQSAIRFSGYYCHRLLWIFRAPGLLRKGRFCIFAFHIQKRQFPTRTGVTWI